MGLATAEKRQGGAGSSGPVLLTEAGGGLNPGPCSCSPSEALGTPPHGSVAREPWNASLRGLGEAGRDSSW